MISRLGIREMDRCEGEEERGGAGEGELTDLGDLILGKFPELEKLQ